MEFENEIQKELFYRSQIDYSYWRMEQLSKQMKIKQSPVSAMIDQATGYEKKRFKDQFDEIRFLIQTVILCKEKLNLDANSDKITLSEINNLTP